MVVGRDPDGTVADRLPAPWSARTTVHEYGGGAYAVGDGVLYFSNHPDGGVYAHRPGAEPVCLARIEGVRFADLQLDVAGRRLICVQEDHRGDGEPRNSLVAIGLDGKGVPEPLAAGEDFYASPALGPDGDRLAWLTWPHPNLPWDGTFLWSAEVGAAGELGEASLVAGGLDESVFQPRWSPAGELWFASDRSGFWNLYRAGAEGAEAMAPMQREVGLPQWVFGMSVYAFDATGGVAFTACDRGSWRLYRRTAEGEVEEVPVPFRELKDVQVAEGRVACVAGGPERRTAVVRIDPGSGAHEEVCSIGSLRLPPASLSLPEDVELETGDGERTHALFYPPAHGQVAGPEGELPPLVVMSHGGPTSMASTALNLEAQFWTSRGFAVADVNYRGSTGYGRAYRVALDRRWGVADVEDCCAVARHLAAHGRVDERRLVIRGGSAGGYTTLAALTFRDVFAAGASYYGIGDLEALARDTHKFEARYLDRLVGPYPEEQELYRQRSPIHFADRLSCPIIFFQGLEDRVVPPNQAETMVAALRTKGVPVAYVPFAGEQHGFRRAENIQRALECELYFYSRVLGFEIPDPPPDLEIENLG